MFAGKEDFKIEYTRGLIETYAKPLKDCTKLEKYENLVRLVSNIASSIISRAQNRAERKSLAINIPLSAILYRKTMCLSSIHPHGNREIHPAFVADSTQI